MKRMRSSGAREAISGYLFIAPWLLGFALFVLGPMLASLYLSFCNYNPSSVSSTIKWIGLENYRRMLFDDPLFRHSLSVTFRYSIIGIPLQLAGGLLIALLLNRNIRGIGVYRTCFYLPVVIGGVATSLVWLWLFSPGQGLLNTALAHLYAMLGGDSMLTRCIAAPLQFLFGVAEEGSLLCGWISSERGALNSLILMSLWSLGGSMIVNLAGLQSIPRIYYEAASIDGAGAWTQFIRITLPLLSPTLYFNLIMGIIGSFQVFTQGFVMTEGGPNDATRFYVLYTYDTAFSYFRMGYASALAWVLFFIILAFTLLVIRSSTSWVHYEAQKR